jgi:hypothetical protein
MIYKYGILRFPHEQLQRSINQRKPTESQIKIILKFVSTLKMGDNVSSRSYAWYAISNSIFKARLSYFGW